MESSDSSLRRWCGALTTAAVLLTASAARGDERLFGYIQEAEVLPKGGREFEQWLTHRRGRTDGVFAAWDFREALEYGITDRATVAGYLNSRSTHSEGVTGLADEDGFELEGISAD